MQRLLRIRTLLLGAAFAASCLTPLVSGQQRTPAPKEFVEWLPVSEADRQLKSPMVEKDAGAEILLWRVHVVDEYLADGLQRVFYHYLRIKVFDAKGKDKVGTVDLPYDDRRGIFDVSGRTIKPDGSIVELDRRTVYKRDLVRAGGRKIKTMSFAMPGVEDGAILEYRWKQSQTDNRFRYLRLEFARDLPVQKATYFMKPLSSDYVASDRMYIMAFNCKATPLQIGDDGWTETSVVNIPADRDEPYAPSDPNVKPWALLYYRSGTPDPQKYWNDEAKKVYNDFKNSLKLDGDQKSAATQAVAGSTTDDEKIGALTDFVRKRLRKLFDDDVTEAERENFIKKLPNNRDRNAAEILKSGIALSSEMNTVFAALAAQVGLDVRPALVANRNEVMVDLRKLPERYFVDDVVMAVKSADSWKLFNVDHKHLFPGMLASDQEGMMAIVTDPKAAIFMPTPISPPEASAEMRTAKLKLSTNGSLSGEVSESYSGHRAEEYRLQLARQSAAQREQWFHDRIVRIFPDAEISAIKLENLDNPSKPFQVDYKLDAPLFAQVTGKRMLFHSNAFRRSQALSLSASERRYPIQFPFAWKEIDQIQIELPQGFALENGDNPGSLDFGEPGAYKLAMSVRAGPPTQLIVSREFTFGVKGNLSFPPTVYPALKKVFDEVQLRDTHTLSLRAN